MDKRLKGTLVGVLCSLAGVGLWILLSAGIGIIAGLAGALMGILFILPYTKLNPDDRSAYPFIVGGILIVVEIAVSEIVSLAIIAAVAEVDFGWLMAIDGMVFDTVLNIVLGVVLSGIVFVGYVLTLRQRTKQAKRMRTGTAAPKGEFAPKDDTSAPIEPFEETGDDKKDGGWKID